MRSGAVLDYLLAAGYRDVRLTLENAIGDTAKTLNVACTENVR